MATASHSIATTSNPPAESESSTCARSPDSPVEENYVRSNEGHDARSGDKAEGTDEFSSVSGLHFSDETIIGSKALVDYLTDFGNAPYDTVIYCSDGSQPIPVHGRVLTAFCPYFFQLFTSQRNLRYGLAKCYVLDMNGVICCNILHYLYYGHIYIGSSTVFGLMKIGRTLELWQLVYKCEEFLKSCIKKENCHFLLMQAKLNQLTGVESVIKVFMNNNGIVDSAMPPINRTNQNLNEFTFDQMLHFLSTRPEPRTEEDEKRAFTRLIQWVGFDATNRTNHLKHLVATIDLTRLPLQFRITEFRMNPVLIADRDCQEMYLRSMESILQQMDQDQNEQQHVMEQPRHSSPSNMNNSSDLTLVASGDDLDVANFNCDDEGEEFSAYIHVDEQITNMDSTSSILKRASGQKISLADEEMSENAPYNDVSLQQPEIKLSFVAPTSSAIQKQKVKTGKKTTKTRSHTYKIASVEQLENEVFNNVPALPVMVFSTGTKARKNIFYAYNFQTQECQVVAETLSRRYQSSFAMKGKMLFDIGGHSPQGSSVKIEYYDTGVISPGTWPHSGWKTGPSLNLARTDFALVTYNDWIYVLGGVNILKNPVPLNGVEKLEVGLDGLKQSRWQPVSSMLEGRRSFSAAVLDDFIFVVGGTGEKLEDLATASKYDIENDSWSDVASMSHRRRNARVAVLNGRLYVVGGCVGVHAFPLNVCEEYIPDNDQWTVLSRWMNMPRNISGVVSYDGKIYAFGGDERNLSAEMYDPISNSWEIFKIPEIMHTVTFHCVALSHNP